MPQLRVLHADSFNCSYELAMLCLRGEDVWTPIRFGLLRVDFTDEDDDFPVAGLDRVGPFAALVADTAVQPLLWAARICMADTAQPAVLDALVDAALARGLEMLDLVSCTPPAAAPLARLLTSDKLDSLSFHACAFTNVEDALFDSA